MEVIIENTIEKTAGGHSSRIKEKSTPLYERDLSGKLIDYNGTYCELKIRVRNGGSQNR